MGMMHACVKRGTNLVTDDIETPVPIAGQALVKTLACGICGSDLHMLHHLDEVVSKTESVLGEPGSSGMDPSADMVFGHEFCGELLDYGPNTNQTVKPGARVVAFPMIFHNGRPQTLGYSNEYPGGFAQHMALTAAMLLEVPNGLAADHAALTEPMAVGEHAVVKADVGPDDASLVIGCGPVGLAVIAALKARGLGPVIAADFSPKRRSLAEALGADIVVDPAVVSPHSRWEGFGVAATSQDATTRMLMGQTLKQAIVFECVGVPGVIDQIVKDSPPHTRIVVVGVCMETDHFEPFFAIQKQYDIRFCLGYSPDEFARSLFNIAEGKIDVAPMITGKVGLSGVAGAFSELSNPEAHAKVIVDPWAET